MVTLAMTTSLLCSLSIGGEKGVWFGTLDECFLQTQMALVIGLG